MNKKNSLIKIIAILAIAHAAAPATAGQLSVVINGKSIHVGSEYSWNEDNRGLGIEYESTGESRWIKTGILNGFRDSLDNMSYMAGAGLKRRFLQTEKLGGLYLDAGLVAFVMYREKFNNEEPFPGVLPVIAAGNRHVGLNLTYIPRKIVHDVGRADRVDPGIQGVFFLQAKFVIGNWGR